MVPFFRIEEGREATKGQAQTCSKRSAWRGLAAAVSMTSCVGMMVVMAWGTSSAPRLEGGHPQQRTTQLAEGGLGGGGVVDSASLAAFTRYLEGGAKRKSRRDQTVVCDGGSSVACIAHGALKGIERDLRRSPTNTPGKEAVQVASRGRGFQAWHLRSLDGKRAEEGLQKVALASRARQHNGIERVFDSVWKGYLKLDHEIDDGFGGNPAPQRAKAAAIPSGGTSGTRQRADRDLEASIADLKKEKDRLVATLRGDAARKVRGSVKKAAEGWLSAPGGWFADGGDVKMPEQSWGY